MVQGDDLSLVQLGEWDIDPTVLETPGQSFLALTADFTPPPSDEVLHHWASLTHYDDWHLLVDREHEDRQLRIRVLCAPDPADPGSWITAVISIRNETWRCQVNEHERIRPGRPMRRRHLHLDWTEEEFTVIEGSEPRLFARLTNTGPTAWHEGAGEREHVIARFVDPTSGEPYPGWVAYAPMADLDHPIELEPSERVVLPVILAPPPKVLTRHDPEAAERLYAGRSPGGQPRYRGPVRMLLPGAYELIGVLTPLDLTSEPCRLTVLSA